MKSTVIWSLVGLNLLLAAVLVARVTPSTSAMAQQAGRRPADYLMVPGQANGLPYTIVYCVDTTNGSLGGMAYDESRKIMQTMPAIDLNHVFGGAGIPPGQPGNNPNGGKKGY